MTRSQLVNIVIVSLLLLCLSSAAALSQEPSTSPQNKTQKKVKPKTKEDLNEYESQSQKIQNLIMLTKGAPAEIRADALLTLETFLKEPSAKKDLLEQVFTAASEVREPVNKRSWARQVDTHSGYMQIAYDLGLDKLSLQSTVVARMLLLDRSRARQLFGEISLPALKPTGCEDALVYNFDTYYGAIQQLFEKSFNAEEIQSGLDTQFLIDHVDEISSISHATGLTKVLVKTRLTPDQLVLVSQAYARALPRLKSEPRSFAYAVERDSWIILLMNFMLKVRTQESSIVTLAQAVQKALHSNFSGDTCGDAAWVKNRQTQLPSYLTSINREFQSPITIEDLTSAKIKEPASDVEYWTTSQGEKMLREARRLRFGGKETALSLEERQTDAWQQSLLNFVQALETWKAEFEASEEDYFFQRCNMYRVLVDICPDGAQRDLVLRSYGSYLKETSGKYKGRIEWVFQVKEYLRALRGKEVQTRERSLDPLENSTDIGLRIYAQLTQLTAAKN